MAEIKFDGESNYFMFCDLAGAEGHTAVSAGIFENVRACFEI